MAAGIKTPPEVRARVIELVRAGKTRREVSEATGVSVRVVSTIVCDTPGVEFAMVGSGSSGTPEAMAKARSYRSEYMRNRRNQIAEKLLDAAERSADLASTESDPRKRQALMQAADASMRAYANVTKMDAAESQNEGMLKAMSMLDTLLQGVQSADLREVPANQGTVEE